MKRVEVEVLGEASNAAVVLLPHRRFPGLVVQGDSLSVLVNTANRAREAVAAGRAEEGSDELGELCELLSGYQAEYERAMGAAGLKLPYIKGTR